MRNAPMASNPVLTLAGERSQVSRNSPRLSLQRSFEILVHTSNWSQRPSFSRRSQRGDDDPSGRNKNGTSRPLRASFTAACKQHYSPPIHRTGGNCAANTGKITRHLAPTTTVKATRASVQLERKNKDCLPEYTQHARCLGMTTSFK